MTNLTNENNNNNYEFIDMLINEGLTVTKKVNKYLVKDFSNNVINIIENGLYLEIFDINGNSEECDIYDLEHIKFATFSALEGEYKSYTIDYVNQHLLDCETGIDEIFVNVKGFNDSVEVVDIIGTIEEKGRIYAGLEIEYEDYCYLVNINFLNTWGYVYKDEMVEIQDVLSNLISEQLKNDLGLKENILDDVKHWIKDNMGQYDNKEDLLREIVTYGVENVAPNHLIYNWDIMDFYDEHYTEIDGILKKDNKKNVGTIEAVWYAWEKVTHEYLKALESK